MKKRIKTLMSLFLFALCVSTISCIREKSAQLPEENKDVFAYVTAKDITSQAINFTDSLLSFMTLEEMAGQCLMPSLLSNSDPSTIRLLKHYIEDYHIGGIVLLKGDTESAEKLAEIGATARIPLFISIDAEWGLGMRLENGKTYPKNGRLGRNSSESELYDYGRNIAEECREIGINMVLGPVIDVALNKGGIIGMRSFGNNPQRVSDFGVAYAKGLESGGVISVAKHFPGHGGTIMDSHKGAVKLTHDITTLDSVDLKPFREYVNSGLTGVMAGHIQSLALDPDGNPASVSIDMLTSLLRDEMGFRGLVLTDAFDMGGAKGFTAAEALKAGADIILCPMNVGEEYTELLKEIKNGELDLRILRDRCGRILFYKYVFGLFSE